MPGKHLFTALGAGALVAVMVLAVPPAGAQTADQHAKQRAVRFIDYFDTDGDGKATIKEIASDHARLFGAVDVNGDNALSVEEFRRRGRLFRTYATTSLFDLLDANGDGKLTVKEITAPSEKWFKRYDKNGNGVMEADELPNRRWGRGRGRYRHR
jgi:Ca2+-binding EF-hand superfamily protein